MKLGLVFLGVFVASFSWAQCGVTGDTLVVESVAELDDLQGCSHILGSLLISENAISGLDQLAELETIEEHFILNDNTSLLSVAGLGALTSVGGNLEFLNNFTLQNLNGLDALNEVGGNLLFEGNITLVHFDALQGCTFEGDITFRENHTLASLAGFTGLTHIAGDLTLNHQNLILADLSGLSEVNSIEGECRISLPKLIHCQGLSNLSECGSLHLTGMPLLGNLDGLQSMQSVQDSLVLQDNPSMVNINALAGLDEIGQALVADNPALMWCCAAANWNLNGAVSGAALFTNNHSNCTDYALIVSDCEPLSIATELLPFQSGWYTLKSYDLAGRLEAEFTQWVDTQEDAFLALEPGVHLLLLIDAKGQVNPHLVVH